MLDATTPPGMRPATPPPRPDREASRAREGIVPPPNSPASASDRLELSEPFANVHGHGVTYGGHNYAQNALLKYAARQGQARRDAVRI
jgi:hypothetical protein